MYQNGVSFYENPLSTRKTRIEAPSSYNSSQPLKLQAQSVIDVLHLPQPWLTKMPERLESTLHVMVCTQVPCSPLAEAC